MLYDDITLSNQVVFSLALSFLAVTGYTVFKFMEQSKTVKNNNHKETEQKKKDNEANYDNDNGNSDDDDDRLNDYHKIQMATTEETKIQLLKSEVK